VRLRKTAGEYTQKEYEEIILFKSNSPESNNLDKVQLKILKKRAKTYDLIDDGTQEAWPKGKVLHKIIFLRNGKRKGN